MTDNNHRDDGGPAFPCTQWEDRGGVNFGSAHDGMTLRQYAAIHLCVPDSGVDWLDEMIERARHDKFAAHALNSMFSDLKHDGEYTITELAEGKAHRDAEWRAKAARRIATSLLTHRKKDAKG